MARCSKTWAAMALMLLFTGEPGATQARILKQKPESQVGDLFSMPGEGLCTTLCKWNRAALVAIDDVYADPDLDDVACGKRCRATAAVVNPGQCRFFACACGDCPAAKMKYATQVQCQKACSGTCVQLYGFVSGADSVHGCTREVASSNPGKGRL